MTRTLLLAALLAFAAAFVATVWLAGSLHRLPVGDGGWREPYDPDFV